MLVTSVPERVIGFQKESLNYKIQLGFQQPPVIKEYLYRLDIIRQVSLFLGHHDALYDLSQWMLPKSCFRLAETFLLHDLETKKAQVLNLLLWQF